jgi:hypothetical protein
MGVAVGVGRGVGGAKLACHTSKAGVASGVGSAAPLHGVIARLTTDEVELPPPPHAASNNAGSARSKRQEAVGQRIAAHS